MIEVPTRFGSGVARLWRGGVRLLPLEAALLRRFVAELPPELGQTVVRQLECYALAQREVDGRALNFYPKRRGGTWVKDFPMLPISNGESRLLALRVRVSGLSGPLHITFTAVAQRFFCMASSRDLKPIGSTEEMVVESATASWRSALQRNES